jgi:hypothetical protein
MSVTKRTKPVADYQVWTASGAGNPTGVSNGDVLDVYSSLGNRESNSVTIESIGGEAVLRFNVVKKIYKQHGFDHNSWINTGQGLHRSSPYLVAEIEETKPDITITANSVQVWNSDEIRVRDIRLVTVPSGLRLTVT